MLTPDLKLPSRMRLKESRRVPMWNGPLECRLFRFDMVAGSVRARESAPTVPHAPTTSTKPASPEGDPQASA